MYVTLSLCMISLCKSVQNYSVHSAFFFPKNYAYLGIQTSIHLNILFKKYVHEMFDFVNFFSPAQGMFRHFLDGVQKNNYKILPMTNTYLVGN